MKREFKFRKWHKELEDMTFWGGGKQRNNLFWHTVSNYPDIYELMQFTGLHDKNGKEIYEGDILHRGLNVCWVVVFKESRWIADSIIDSGLYINSTEFNTCSIEGNIYENPELLTH